MNDKPVSQPVALITGAAGGIGSAAAAAFANQGYAVALTDVNESALQTLADQIQAGGGSVLCLPGDLTDLAFAEQTVRNTAERWGRLDVLISNATWRDTSTMRQITVEAWERTLRMNLTVPAFMARWAAEVMEPAGKGVIIQVASIMAERTNGISPAYSTAKGGLSSLTYDLAALWGRRGIRVVTIAPGSIDTFANRKTRPPGAVTELLDLIPLGREGKPGEIANLMLWLASDQASYITGTTIIADGGLTHQLSSYSRKHEVLPDEFG